MTNDTRTPEQIERDIEAERSELTSNLEGLQDKFSIDTLVRQVGDQFREHGGDLGRSISDQVKANPIPLALTGIGLAWMMFGNGQRPVSTGGYSHAEEDFRRTRQAQGRVYTPPVRRAVDYDTGPNWARDDYDDDYGNDYDDGTSVTDRLSDGAHSVKDSASKGADSARRTASSAASSVAEGASQAGASISDTASRAGASVSDAASRAGSSVSNAASSARSSVASGARSVQSGVAAAGSRIAEGTENLTEEGRRRVIAARQKAVEMRRNAAQSLSQGTDAAADFYDRQPLVVGALALAVGAALGGALPRTRTEDDLMGTQSDNLYEEAERIFEEEKAKAMEVAKAAKDEAGKIAEETKSDLDSGAPGDKSAVEAVGDKAKSSAKRVADAAKEKAKDEDLGKPKT